MPVLRDVLQFCKLFFFQFDHDILTPETVVVLEKEGERRLDIGFSDVDGDPESITSRHLVEL